MTLAIESLRPSLALVASELKLSLLPAQSDALIAYLGLLSRWNTTYNLTSVREPATMLVQHVADCLAVVLPFRRQAHGQPVKVLDVGSGAGLPGAVLAIMNSDDEVTCIDAVGKKAAFVQQVIGELGLRNLRAIHGRVEAPDGDRYEVVTSRAFASLADFINLTRTRLSPGGIWMAMKGKRPTSELAALPSDVDVFHVEQISVPGLEGERCLVWMRPDK
jgi:16S rRNA (guanine527-N7)-methyltransferase